MLCKEGGILCFSCFSMFTSTSLAVLCTTIEDWALLHIRVSNVMEVVPIAEIRT